MNKNDPKTGIVKIGDFLLYGKLHIPPYQRPYKWTTKNIVQLLEDIETFKKKESYRIGTVVIHDDAKKWNIVDGQQRTITFILLTKAIISHKLNTIQNPTLVEQIETIDEQMAKHEFTSEITFRNIQDNYKELERRVINIDEAFIDFFYNKCEVTQFILNDISEAFQFFDSQNARGKDLEPHDLLKAYHLREFSEQDKPQEAQIVDTWEDTETEELATLFADFLYRIKGWSKGNSSRYFTKNDTPLFKGINLEKIEKYPFVEMLRISDTYTTQQNDKEAKGFPFQLDQIIVNGKRFFEMITHYKSIYDTFKKESVKKDTLNENAIKIMEVINDYEGMYRTGDKYVRLLFDCALIYYIDKFGYNELSYVIEKIFVWAYQLRLSYQNIQMASADNHVLKTHNMFKAIREAFSPREVIAIKLPLIIATEVKSTKTTKIEELLKQLKYYA